MTIMIKTDKTAPKATIDLSNNKLTSGSTSTVTITFSEKVKGFTLSDVKVKYGTLSNFATTDNITWTVILAPTHNIKGNGYIAIWSKSLTDMANNYNKTAYSKVYQVMTKDAIAPKVTSITLSDTSLSIGETAVVSIVFSEAVKGFSLSDLSISNGALAHLSTTDKINWTATLTPATDTESTGTITLKAKSLTDSAGNYNASSLTTSFTLDTLLSPVVTPTEAPTEASTEAPTEAPTSATDSLAQTASLRSKQIAGYQSSESLSSSSSIVQALASSDKWSSSQITYSFNATFPSEYVGESSDGSTYYGNLSTGWKTVSAEVQSFVGDIMAQVNEYTGLTISQTSGTGDIRFNMIPTATDVAAFAYYPGKGALDGDVFIDTDIDELWVGGYGYSTLVHELGHALGLKHPFEDGIKLPTSQDNGVNSIMSYTDYRQYVPEIVTTKKADGASSISANYDTAIYPSTFMVYDIAALQNIYGVDTRTKTGNDTYTYSKSPAYNTIWDAGGIDTIDLSQTTYSDTLYLTSGRYSTINYRSVATQIAEQQAVVKTAIGSNYYNNWVASVYNDYSSDIYTGENALGIAYGAIIENAIGGSASDTFYDNSVDNVIKGGAGDDLFYLGAGGYDTICGDAGNDQLVLSTKTKTSVQIEKQTTGETIVLADNFAVKLIGVESIQFSDQSYTV